MIHNEHAHYLKQALDLAQIPLGSVAPNPSVGAVLVKNGEVLSVGNHQGPGTPHAEVVAIGSTSESKGADLYVTLEPCCHEGRTPPCTDLIIRSGIKTVYYGMDDPNPVVSGQGIRQLERAGITCHRVALPEIEHFYRAYRYWTAHQRPWVTAKLAISLDGKSAGPGGQPIALTGKALAHYTHQCRKETDALLTTANTIIRDNPRLNVRLDTLTQQKPIYILDSELRLPLDATLWETAKEITLFYRESSHSALNDRKQQLLHAAARFNKKVTLAPVPNDKHASNRLDLEVVLSRMGQDGIHHLWVEAGGRGFESFLHSHLLQEALLYIAPQVLGPEATSAFTTPFSFSKKIIIESKLYGSDTLLHIDFTKMDMK